MNVLLLLVPVLLVLAVLGLVSFLWTLRHHQYDVSDGDAWRILDDKATAPAVAKAEVRQDEA